MAGQGDSGDSGSPAVMHDDGTALGIIVAGTYGAGAIGVHPLDEILSLFDEMGYGLELATSEWLDRPAVLDE